MNVAPLSLARRSVIAFACITIASVVSYVSWSAGHPAMVLIPIVLLLLYFAKYEPDIVWAIWVGELLVGGHGHLFTFETGYGAVSIRELIFGALLIAAAVRLSEKPGEYWRKRLISNWQLYGITRLFTIVALIILLGLIIAYAHGIPLGDVFASANGWFFWVIAPLILFWERPWWRTWWSVRGIPVLIAGIAWLAFESYALLILFSFNIPAAFTHIYDFVRQSGIGEITRVTESYYRVFLYSQVYALIAWAIGLFYVLTHKKHLSAGLILIFISELILFISLSRSFWVGQLGITVLMFVFVYWKRGFSLRRLTSRFLIAAAVALSAVGIVQFTVTAVNPAHVSGVDFGERFDLSDPAGASRMQLLAPLWTKNEQAMFMGDGFGTRVLYTTSDPRICEQNPDCLHDAIAFEWGYLGIMLHVGIVGLVAYMFVWGIIVMRRIESDSIIPTGMAFGVIGVIGVHMFTPYIDHPLGIGMAVLLCSWPFASRLMGMRYGGV